MNERTTVHDLLRQVADLSGQQREDFIAALPESQRSLLLRELASAAPTIDLNLADPTDLDPRTVVPSGGKSAKRPRSDAEDPATIGPYIILQRIGEGGMGQVFIAEQHKPIKRRVALKIIKTDTPSREILARFDAERQALAIMDHQNIAKVLDAGITADGRPYFAMELVRGIPITSYCDQYRLTPQQRLELFVQTCRAIQHAHQRGIIHRDIKPSNVLVTEYEGRPIAKVIDFGLAKALQEHTLLTDQTLFTQYGQIVGTLEYMSPEQAELSTLDIDTRTDVYSLGVIMYELLTGSTPLGRQRIKSEAYDQVLRMIREEDPPRMIVRLADSAVGVASISELRNIEPKRLSYLLRGDLEWIAMKSLEKDRSRRYDGAGALADDVDRYLNDEPIDARPPTLTYRIHKTYRKHKASFITAVGVACLLIAGLLGTGMMWFRAENEASRASLAERKALIQAENARDAETEAVTAKTQVEATLARSNYYLALARWNAGQVNEARDLLQRVPPDFRNFEWYLARRQFLGGDITLYGHASTVADVAYRPDGQQVASASFDKTVKLWNPQTGRLLTTLSGHSSNVTCIAYSADGKRIASGSADKTIRIWDPGSDQPIILKGHSGPINRVRFSPDGSLVVSASWDKTVRIWDAATGKLRDTLKGHRGEVLDVAIAPNDSYIASCSRDNTIRLWNSNGGEFLRSFKGHADLVTSVTFHPHADEIASGSFDHTVRLWDLHSGETVKSFKGHVGHVTSVRYSPDGARIISATDDYRGPGMIRIWNARSGTLTQTLKGHEHGITSVAFSPDGSRIASGGGYGENTIKLWDARSGDENLTFKGHLDRVSSVAISPDGRRIASGSYDYSVVIWDASAAQRIGVLRGHQGPVTSVAFSNDGSMIASGSEDHVVKLWAAESGKLLRTLPGPKGSVTSVAFSPDDQSVAAGSWDHSVTLWSTKSGEIQKTLAGHTSGVLTIAFSPSGNLLVSAGGYGNDAINLWDTVSGKVVRSFQGHSSHVTGAAFSPNGAQLASVSTDRTIKLWDATSGELKHSLERHTNRVDDIAFSADGSRLASASYDNTIQLWDTATGDQLRTIKGHSNYVTGVSFSRDGQYLVSASWDKTVKLWRATTASEFKTLHGHTDNVTEVAFNPNSSLLATAGNDRSIRRWNVADGSLTGVMTGHAAAINGLAFDQTGTRLLSTDTSNQRIAWDAATSKQIPDFDQWPELAVGPGNLSPDARWLALTRGNQIDLIDQEFKNTLPEKTYRLAKSRFDTFWHQDLAADAENSQRWPEALFHRACVVDNEPLSNVAHWQMRMVVSKVRNSNPQLLQRLPPLARAALAIPVPPLNEQYAEQLNFLLLARVAVDAHEPITDVSLQELVNICEQFEKGRFFHTLGIAQYRAGNTEAAIDSLTKSLVLMPTEFNLPGPHPGDLAFLAMCHFKLGEHNVANDFRNELIAGVEKNAFNSAQLNQLASQFLQEVNQVFESRDSGKP